MENKSIKRQEDKTERVPTKAGGIIMIVIGILLWLGSLFALLLTTSFFAGAEKGEATITSVRTGRETEMSSDGFSGHSSDVTVYYYTFCYGVNGVIYTGEYKESATWTKSAHRVGEVITIYYDPEVPEVYKVKNATVGELIILVCGIASCIAGILEIRKAEEYKRLYL